MRYLAKPSPVEGVPPSEVFRDCFRAVCDTKLKLSMTDAPFNQDIMNSDSFSGQVRSLTYDVISKPSQFAR